MDERELEDLIDRALSDYYGAPPEQLAERVMSEVRMERRPMSLASPAGWIKAATAIAAAILISAFVMHDRTAAHTSRNGGAQNSASEVRSGVSANVSSEVKASTRIAAARDEGHPRRTSSGHLASRELSVGRDQDDERDRLEAPPTWVDPAVMQSASIESVTTEPRQLATISEESLPELHESSPHILH